MTSQKCSKLKWNHVTQVVSLQKFGLHRKLVQNCTRATVCKITTIFLLKPFELCKISSKMFQLAFYNSLDSAFWKNLPCVASEVRSFLMVYISSTTMFDHIYEHARILSVNVQKGLIRQNISCGNTCTSCLSTYPNKSKM